MRSYVIYGTVEADNELAINPEWMEMFFKHVDVYHNDNIGIIYGIKCLLDKNGTIEFKKSQKKSLDEFMILYKKKVPDANCCYFTGIPVEDIDYLEYGMYDLDDLEDEDDEDEEDDE